jgi:hypothetical protein
MSLHDPCHLYITGRHNAIEGRKLFALTANEQYEHLLFSIG